MAVRTLTSSVTAVLLFAACVLAGVAAPDVPEALRRPLQWVSTPPLQSPIAHPGMDCYSVKDPTIVRHGGKWHLFTTIRGTPRSHAVEYTSFEDFSQANSVKRHLLKIADGYYCAPQVFYFTPHKKWYLIYQTNEPSRKPSLQPAFSTNDDIADPEGWSRPALLYDAHPGSVGQWIDFWVICDEAKAHLFFTSHDGRLWRSETALADFPRKFTEPQVVLKGNFFEACNIYALKGGKGYLALIEAIADGRRYFQSYHAARLDEAWTPLAGSIDKPFAARSHVTFPAGKWADSISHGELIRTGFDEKLEIDPDNLQLLYQGVTDGRMRGKPYGEIPWQLGILKPAKP